MILRAVAAVLLSALAAGAAGPEEKDLKAVVRAVERRYEKARTLKATFLERYSEGRRAVRVESGTVYFSRPGRMRWEYEAPESKFFLSDGKTVWFYVPDDRTVTRAKLKESSDWRTPLVLLTGKARFSRFCGRLEWADVRLQARDNLALRCLPKSDDAPFHEVIFEVDAAYRLVRILIREPGKVETEFLFANWRENVALPEVMFHFQAPPGVAIVDEASLAGPAP
jgi:outer membrane lipoprotein carrier protein